MLTLRFAAALACCGLAFGQPLRELAARRGIHIGAAVDPSYLAEPGYPTTLGGEFNQVEPENAMKFGVIHPKPDEYTFGPADSIVDFGLKRGMVVRGHTLVWHKQNPDWLTGAAVTSEVLRDHIRTVVGKYAGKVYAWDVVNEAFNDDGSLRSTIWSNSPGIGLPGTGYIEQAFRWAHEADPNALLFYNDYGADGINSKSDAIYAMAKDFLARGVPLHGIGMQMHLMTSGFDAQSVAANIKRLTDLGLEVQITELDVRLPVDILGVATSSDLATQAQIYGDVFRTCLRFPKCTAVQTWGFTDKHSWIPGLYKDFGAALPFDLSYNPKPAYDAIATALKTAPSLIPDNGLVNAASWTGGAVAPKEIVVLFGASYGPSQLTQDPEALKDVHLRFDGEEAQMIYAKVGQMAAVVPAGVAGKTTTQMQYEYMGARSNAVTVPVHPTFPSLFTLDSSGHGPGAITDVNGNVISKDNPARHGGYIVVYGTGGGMTPEGATMTIGGVNCEVTYSGRAGNLVDGALQLNVIVSRLAPSGEQPIVVTIGGVRTQAGVTVAVE